MTQPAAVESPAKAGNAPQQPNGWSSILTSFLQIKIKMDPGFRRDDDSSLFSVALNDNAMGMPEADTRFIAARGASSQH